MSGMRWLLWMGLLLAAGLDAPAQAQSTDSLRSELTATLQPGHPRLLFLQQDEARLANLQNEDPYFADLVRIVIAEAELNLQDSVIVHRKIGRRLLKQCRASLSRILHLSMAYRLTGEQKYLERAEAEMLAAAALTDWNPSHFLDAAEMATGLAIGYDWLYSDLSTSSRKKIRTALIEKALQPALAQTHWWEHAHNNWNQVCNTGLAVAALAIAEDEPALAEKMVARACVNLPIAMKTSYEPMGCYPEGPMYWEYGTTFNVLLIAALETALGSDCGLVLQKGFAESALYRLLVVGPDRAFFGYSDCSGTPETSAALYWFTQRFGKPEYAWLIRENEEQIVRQMVQTHVPAPARFFPLTLLWYSPGDSLREPLPLDFLGQGANPIALFRSSWDRDALWLAFKGGNNENSHNHMDAGQVVILAKGIRWCDDLGADDYYVLEQLPGNLWGEGRYDFFRLGVQGHSTLMLNGEQPQIKESDSPIIKFFSSSGRSHAVVDMSKSWRKCAKKVLRGAAMVDKQVILLQDEITAATGEILWQMITPAEIRLDGDSAVLAKNGQTFRLRILAPANHAFEELDVKPRYSQENQNEGYTKLAIRIQSPDERVVIAVQMGLEQGEKSEEISIVPLCDWAE